MFTFIIHVMTILIDCVIIVIILSSFYSLFCFIILHYFSYLFLFFLVSFRIFLFVSFFFFFFKQKPAYEFRFSDWSSDVCSSDLLRVVGEINASDFLERLNTAGVS